MSTRPEVLLAAGDLTSRLESIRFPAATIRRPNGIGGWYLWWGPSVFHGGTLGIFIEASEEDPGVVKIWADAADSEGRKYLDAAFNGQEMHQLVKALESARRLIFEGNE